MIDGSEKRKRQLVFQLQSSRVYEKRSKRLFRNEKIILIKLMIILLPPISVAATK